MQRHGAFADSAPNMLPSCIIFQASEQQQDVQDDRQDRSKIGHFLGWTLKDLYGLVMPLGAVLVAVALYCCPGLC